MCHVYWHISPIWAYALYMAFEGIFVAGIYLAILW